MSKGSYDIVNPDDPVIQERIKALLSISKIDLVLCYGVRRKSSHQWSLFSVESADLEAVDLDVLIVIQQSEKHREHELIDRVNRMNTEALRLLCVIHNADAVKESLTTDSPFFRSVLEKGVLLYQNPSYQRPQVAITTGDSQKPTIYWEYHTHLAAQFLSGARFHFNAGQYPLSSFMLHQATERICSAAIRQFIGYRVTSHNISRLLSLTECISPIISGTFPMSSDDERNSFNLLAKAYSHVRYHDSFDITEIQTRELLEQVESLIENVLAIYDRRTNSQFENNLSEASIQDKLSFQSIRLDTHHHVVLCAGDRDAVKFEPPNARDTTSVELEGDRVTIAHNTKLADQIVEGSTIYITYTELNAIVVDHVGGLTTAQPIKADRFAAVNNSNDEIDLQIDAFTVEVTQTKKGIIILSGATDELTVLNTGSGAVDALNLIATEGKVTIKNSGTVKINVAGRLLTNLSEKSELVIKGNPDLVEE